MSQAVKEHFDANARPHGGGHWHATKGLFQTRMHGLIRDAFAHLESRGRLLDIGCGDGTYTAFARHFFRQTVAIDFSPAQLANAHDSKHVDYRAFDIERADLALLGRYDAIMAILVFELLDDPMAALGRLSSLLEPRGRGLIVIPAPASLHMRQYRAWEEQQPRPLPWNRISRRRLAQALPALGCRALAQGSFHKLPPMMLQRRLRGASRSGRFFWSTAAAAIERLPIRGSYEYLLLEKLTIE